MRVKSHYRKFKDGGVVTADIVPAPETSISIDTDASPKDIADDASVAFQKQIYNLRQAEDIQRQRQAAQASAPAIDQSHIEAYAALDASHQGLQPDDPRYPEAVKAFEDMHRLSAPPAAAPTPLSPPAFEPLPSRPSGRASMFSAPVSRETQATGSYNSYGERPGEVRLSVAQKEAARYAGVSEAEYARGVLRLRQEKEDGFRQ